MKRESWIKLFIAIGIVLFIHGMVDHNPYTLGIGVLTLALAGSKL